jgi:hypothetical protein
MFISSRNSRLLLDEGTESGATLLMGSPTEYFIDFGPKHLLYVFGTLEEAWRVFCIVEPHLKGMGVPDFILEKIRMFNALDNGEQHGDYDVEVVIHVTCRSEKFFK